MILLVDDNRLLRTATREALESAGHTVAEAGDAAEALGRARSVGAIDLLITDLRMPGDLDGLALAEALRRGDPAVGHHPTTALPVLLVSTDPLDDRLAALGPNAEFLPKPFAQSLLLEAAERLLAGRGRGVFDELTSQPGRGREGGDGPTDPSDPPAPPDASRSAARSGWRLGLLVAATLALLLGAGLLVSMLHQPATSSPPPPRADDVRRGATILDLAPSGPIGRAPAEFRWRAHPDARSYRAALRGVDGRILARAASSSPQIVAFSTTGAESPLPLLDFVVYDWRVEAFDASGDLVGVSPWTRFRIVPRGPTP